MSGDAAFEQPKSLLAPYDKGLFVQHRGWVGVRQILETRGAGSYGLSGPRGGGKSWVIERALDLTDEKKGLSVLFPSPSEYEPLAFLAALSDHVASDFENLYDKITGRPTKAARQRFMQVFGAGTLFLYIAFAIGFLSAVGGGEGFGALLNFGTAIVGLFLIVGVGLMTYAVRRRRDEREGLGRVRAKAEELRSQVRFTVTSTESDEVGLTGAYGGLTGLLKRARQRQLVERPATLSSLIHAFRAFVREIADAEEVKGPVVIAIDELDKMSDSSRVAQLLRDIKGIFEIQGACFLVSISDEAAQALELGAVRARNEFNSSFYTVISMPPLSPRACLDVLRLRDPGFDSECGRAVGILTGGINRELVRIAELVRVSAGATPTLEETVAVTIGEELDAFGSWVLHSAGARGRLAALGDVARLKIFEAVEGAKGALVDGGEAIPDMLVDGWDLNAGNAVWSEQFAEEWRRLLVRLGVAAEMLSDPEAIRDEIRAKGLQRIITIASASSAVGRRYLERVAAPVASES